MERKLHSHKYTPTHHSKRNCLASSSFQSMNTPPPPAKKGQEKKKWKLKRQKFFYSLREIFNELPFNGGQGDEGEGQLCEGKGRRLQNS